MRNTIDATCGVGYMLAVRNQDYDVLMGLVEQAAFGDEEDGKLDSVIAIKDNLMTFIFIQDQCIDVEELIRNIQRTGIDVVVRFWDEAFQNEPKDVTVLVSWEGKEDTLATKDIWWVFNKEMGR